MNEIVGLVELVELFLSYIRESGSEKKPERACVAGFLYPADPGLTSSTSSTFYRLTW